MDALKRIIGIPVGLASKAVEGTLDIPHNLYGLGKAGIKKLTGYEGPEKLSLPRGPLSGLINLVQGKSTEESVPVPLPTGKQYRENIANPVAEATIGKENIQPQSFAERQAHKVAYGAPFQGALAALGIGPAITGASLGAGLVGSAAAEGVESQGFGPLAQTAASLLAERKFGKLLNFAQNAPAQVGSQLNKMAQEEKSKYYTQQRDLGTGKRIDAISYDHDLNDILHKNMRKTNLSTTQKNELSNKVEHYLSDIQQGKVDINKLVDRRTELNDLIGKTKDRAEKNIYQHIREKVTSEIDKAKKVNPSWGKALDSADTIHKLQNWESDFIADESKWSKVLTNPLAIGAATLFGGGLATKNPLLAGALGAGTSVLSYGVKKGLEKGVPMAKEIYSFMQSPETRSILEKATNDWIKGSIPEALSSYNKLNHKAEEFKKKEIATQKDKANKQKEIEEYNRRLGY